MVRPLVTVVVTTYQRYGLAKRAIESVLRQTYEPLELIVIEDGLDSGIATWLEQKRFKNIRYIRHEENRGLSAARNSGLETARGEYIAYLDDDNTWVPEKIALQLSLLRASGDRKCLAYCGARWLSRGRITRELIPDAKGRMSDYIYKGYTLVASCMMVHTDTLRSIGGHSEEMVSCIDHDIWMKMAGSGFTMEAVPQALVAYQDSTGHSQMKNRLDQRLVGIGQFFRKWKPIVLKECGATCWKDIERVYHRQTIGIIKDQYRNGAMQREDALSSLRKLISMQSRPLVWADYLVCCTGRWNYVPLDTNMGRLLGRAAKYPFRRIIYKLKG